MFKNYLKIAWRNLVRNKAYSTINIAGLALGMAVALLIGLWVADELNVNRNFAHYDRIVRFMHNTTGEGHTETWNRVPIAMADVLRTKYVSDLRSVAMMSDNSGHILTYGESGVGSDGCRYVEPEFLDMLSLPMIRGDHHGVTVPIGDADDISLGEGTGSWPDHDKIKSGDARRQGPFPDGAGLQGE
jgi:putative ABC transport system permease protein